MSRPRQTIKSLDSKAELPDDCAMLSKMGKCRRLAWMQLSNQLAAEMRAQRGFLPRLTAKLSEQTGLDWKRQELHQWLHPDFGKRVEPRAGTWWLLERAWRSLSDGQ
jgi:hypothetical protein